MSRVAKAEPVALLFAVKALKLWVARTVVTAAKAATFGSWLIATLRHFSHSVIIRIAAPKMECTVKARIFMVAEAKT
jgi:hypothetical protein